MVLKLDANYHIYICCDFRCLAAIAQPAVLYAHNNCPVIQTHAIIVVVPKINVAITYSDRFTSSSSKDTMQQALEKLISGNTSVKVISSLLLQKQPTICIASMLLGLGFENQRHTDTVLFLDTGLGTTTRQNLLLKNFIR